MQITALVENSSLDKNLGTEHGLSLYRDRQPENTV